jgi:hypothetical protein
VTGADTLIHCVEQVWDGRADIRLAINKNYDPSTATVRNEIEVDPHRNASPTRHGETEVDATSMAHAKDDSSPHNANVAEEPTDSPPPVAMSNISASPTRTATSRQTAAETAHAPARHLIQTTRAAAVQGDHGNFTIQHRTWRAQYPYRTVLPERPPRHVVYGTMMALQAKLSRRPLTLQSKHPDGQVALTDTRVRWARDACLLLGIQLAHPVFLCLLPSSLYPPSP